MGIAKAVIETEVEQNSDFENLEKTVTASGEKGNQKTAYSLFKTKMC